MGSDVNNAVSFQVYVLLRTANVVKASPSAFIANVNISMWKAEQRPPRSTRACAFFTKLLQNQITEFFVIFVRKFQSLQNSHICVARGLEMIKNFVHRCFDSSAAFYVGSHILKTPLLEESLIESVGNPSQDKDELYYPVTHDLNLIV